MNIREAVKKDIPKINNLLSQVLEIHAKIRPDIFISGTTKYAEEELENLIEGEETIIYVAVNEEDEVIGYAFCMLKEQPFSTNMVPFHSMYIDDLCVDQTARGLHVGQALFEYVKQEAKKRGCYEITLNVWEGNSSAKHFYEKMGLTPQKTQMEFILK